MKQDATPRSLWKRLTSDDVSGRYIAVIIIAAIGILLCGLLPARLRILTVPLYLLLSVGILYFAHIHSSRPTAVGRILVTLSMVNFIATLCLPIARLSTLLSSALLIAYAVYCAKPFLLSMHVPRHPVVVYGMFAFEFFLTTITVTRYTFVENHRFLHFWKVPLVLAILLTALTAWFMVKGTVYLKDGRMGERICLLLLVLFFSFVALTFTACNLNYALDTGEPTHVPAIVREKHVSTGEMTRYKLTVIVSGTEMDIEVSRDTYKGLEVGDRVTVDIYDGAFGDAYCYLRKTESYDPSPQ